MADAAGAGLVWIDLASTDAAGSRSFYSKLLGWEIEVNPDPQYGGYALAKIGGKDVAGIGPTQSPQAPTAWSLYARTDDADALAGKVTSAGGKVVAPAFDVGPLGRMAVFQDPIGAFVSAWQPKAMGGFQTGGPNTFAWAELNGRGVEKAIPFYQKVFGWSPKISPAAAGAPGYTEFQVGGQSIAGAMEMASTIPAQVPSFWLVYFATNDVDASVKKARDGGAREMMGPQDFPGGRFAVLGDPQGAAFGLLKMAAR